jgi:hypothetical protein
VLAVAELSTDARRKDATFDRLHRRRALHDCLELGLKRSIISSRPLFQSGHGSFVQIPNQNLCHRSLPSDAVFCDHDDSENRGQGHSAVGDCQKTWLGVLAEYRTAVLA